MHLQLKTLVGKFLSFAQTFRSPSVAAAAVSVALLGSTIFLSSTGAMTFDNSPIPPADDSLLPVAIKLSDFLPSVLVGLILLPVLGWRILKRRLQHKGTHCDGTCEALCEAEGPRVKEADMPHGEERPGRCLKPECAWKECSGKACELSEQSTSVNRRNTASRGRAKPASDGELSDETVAE